MIDRASCQGCGEVTIYTDAEACLHCDGLLLRVDFNHRTHPGRADNNITRWDAQRREQVLNAYAQGHGIPEIANVVFEAMNYKNRATARAAIRQEFKRMNVALRSPRACQFAAGCRRDAVTGSDLCFSHDPSFADQRKAHLDLVRVQYQAGENHHNAKLTEDEARAIQASDEAPELLAVRYGITEGQARVIQRGDAWSHLEAAA